MAVNRLSSGTVASCEITSLEDEIGDDSVEFGVSVTETFSVNAKCTEIFGGSRADVVS